MLFVVLAVISIGNAEGKPIRLRNEIIETESPAQKAKSTRLVLQAEDGVETSGLFLIQLTGAAKAGWREELRAHGVDLLRYVPDDAFVARLDKAKPDEIRKLDFVLWVGKYENKHKLHPLLDAARTNVASETVDVAVLMPPQATESDAVQTRRIFQSIRQESHSRFGRVIRGKLNRRQLESLARSDSVLWIEPAPRMKLFDEVSSKIVAGDGGPNTLLSQSLGYDGSGVKVAVADTGLDNGNTNTMHPDLSGRVTALFQYGSLLDASDPHGHGTHCAGIIAGNGATGETDENGALYGLGVAPGASIVAQRMFDANGDEVVPLSFEELTSDAKSAGAVIGSNSWGKDTQGRYDLSAMEFDALVRDADTNMPGDQPYILEFSAGNAGPGPQTIASPAVAKNVIAAGASQNGRTNLGYYADGINAMADFSSRGPCEDGRIKPDLVAPGTWIASLKSQSASGAYALAVISSNYVYESGTSQSGPHVAGAAAVFVQYYRLTHTNTTPSPALVKAALINSAADMNDPLQTTSVPNNDEGWGRVDLTAIFGSGRNFDLVDQTVLLTNRQLFQRQILVAGSDTPLKVTLTYTDVPGFPGAIPALVNNLNLEVIAPDGKSYHGNQFDKGQSVPGAAGWDSINNVEGILISTPLPGQYTVRVHATNVVDDARADTPGVDDQDFALVSSGHLAALGESIVVLDRQAYTAPGHIKITVIDPDKTNSSSVTVSARSTTEPLGENYALSANGASGTFTGKVATLSGTATTDSKLQITNGNWIEVRYFDASAGSNRLATAVADLVPPILNNVIVTNQFGHIVINWTSDEPANSIVRFNTNSSLTRAVTNAALVTQHSVPMEGLITGTNYYFIVSSSDEAGNISTNSNGGALFNFVAVPPAMVLLVDDFHDDLYDNLPPLSGYTDPLEALGVSFDIWSTSGGNPPALSDLLAHRVVIWRLPEFSGTWSPAEQNALANFLASGGSLFVASMQALSRLDESGYGAFRKNTLKVQSYEPNVSVSEIVGASNDPVGNGISTNLDYTIYESPAKNSAGIPGDVSDTIAPSSAASPVYYSGSGDVCGLRFPRVGQDSAGRLVFLSFPLDAVPMTGDTTNNRVHLLGNVLRFLVPGFDDRATVALDSPAYTIPSQVTVEVDDQDRAGEGSLTNVIFTSSTQTNATTLTLSETPRPGKFRGFITLVHATNAPAPGTLRVQNGNIIRAEYFDPSSGLTVNASAVVDTALPLVSNVVATPSYVQAVVAWNTSKPCDALVQYGESPLSFRTAYNPTPSLTHQIIVQNLDPDTLYYFRVVSRDIAGNATTDDNGGQFYTFTTLQPMLPPWSDNMDGSSPGWTVSSSGTTQSQWMRGPPNNGVTNGFSPPNAWGCNLNSNSINEADTSLISPGILLVGGNHATLTFWHNYDFPGDNEYGDLYIITNDNLSAPVRLLPTFNDDSGGWQKVEVDLTTNMGKIVNILWHYTLVSAPAQSAPRPGWLVDDVSITVTNTTPGTIQISNNLWQANFTLSNSDTSVSISGRGTFFVLTNTPPGQYVVNYADVAYYQTPQPQATNLPPGGSILFQGNYTFSDANSNGISDTWELQHFGGVSTNRTAATDTDGDGVSDLKEFLAGTDANSPLPPFRVAVRMLGDGTIELQWPTAPGHSYLVYLSTDFSNWVPFSGSILAGGPTTNYVFSPDPTDVPQLFRVAGTDNDVLNGTAALFRVTPTLLEDGSVELDWPSTLDRAYRVHGSANATSWTPYSGWIQANGTTTSYLVPPLTNGAPYLFRVEVAP